LAPIFVEAKEGMNMRKAIVVDAGCDLSEADRKALGIELWPIEIVHPQVTELDTRDERTLLALYQSGTDSLLEATTRPMDLMHARAKLMEFATRRDELLYLSIMTTRSPAMSHAKQASDSLPLSLRTERKVRALPPFRFVARDSHQLFSGYAWVGAFAALELQQKEVSIDSIAAAVEGITPKLSGYLIPGELRTIRERAMRKGEKSVGFFSYALGTALDVKPIIACRNGLTNAVGRIRGMDNAIAEIVGLIIAQIESGKILYPLVTLVYGGDLRALHRMEPINRLDQACRKHGVRLLRSMMSATGVVNVGAGGLSIAIASSETPYGDFSVLR
jgi:fatty acid-binding protein DegV